MRALSIVSDIEEAVFQLCEDAMACEASLEPKDIVSIVNKSLANWMREVNYEEREHKGYPGQ